MAGNIFNRYIWLVDTINRAGRITFAEINRKWQQMDWSYGKELPLRTFHNYKEKIQEMFDINIDCDGFNQYYIATDMNSELRNWLLHTFSVNNLIHESHNLNGRILFEEIPSGQQFLTAIIEAMRDRICFTMNYRAFWMDESLPMTIKPLCIKIFRQRWYVIGENCATNQIRCYALDRIIDIQPSAAKFKMPRKFNPSEHFANNFGVAVYPGIKPCTVEIRAFGNKRKYLITLPLHASQKEIETKDNYSVFQYYIAPTPDFIQELLTHGDEIEVLSPESLRRKITQKIEKMRILYKKDQ
jgi:hypothetical protein